MSLFFKSFLNSCGGEYRSGEKLMNRAIRPEDISWIKNEIGRLYPSADLGYGVDLNNDGRISGDERISDYNVDGFTGDEVDWRGFLEKNKAVLQTVNGVFKWGVSFRPENIIHDVIGTESEIYTQGEVQNAYAILSTILNEVKKRIQCKNLSPKEKMDALLAVTKEMGYVFGGNDIAGDLTSALNGGRLDCDTFAYIALAVSEELGWNLNIASAPLHVYMRFGEGKELLALSYVEPGKLKVEDEKAYINDEGVTEEELKNGLIYFRNLNRNEIKALQLLSRGWGKVERGLYEEAIKDYDLLISWNVKDPYAYNDKGVALVLLGRKEEAIENFKKALSLHKDDWLIELCLETFSKDPSSAGDYRNRASLYFNSLELPHVALANALKAKELAPDDPDVYLLLRKIYLRLGNPQGAHEALNKFNELQSKCPLDDLMKLFPPKP